MRGGQGGLGEAKSLRGLCYNKERTNTKLLFVSPTFISVGYGSVALIKKFNART